MAGVSTPRPGRVFCCKDYRFIQPIQHFVKRRLGIPLYDLKATAGGVRAMLDAPSIVRKWIMKDIDLVHRLHGIRRIIVVQHQDCAAYGGSSRFAGPEDERQFQAVQLQRAKTTLQALCADTRIDLFFARRRGVRVTLLPIR